jgi:hypothetical protein
VEAHIIPDFLHKRKPPIWQLSSALRRPRKPCRLALNLFGNTPKQTPAASSLGPLLAMVATWVRRHRHALRSSMSALRSRSNHDNLTSVDIAYAPPCKLKTRSSKPRFSPPRRAHVERRASNCTHSRRHTATWSVRPMPISMFLVAGERLGSLRHFNKIELVPRLASALSWLDCPPGYNSRRKH